MSLRHIHFVPHRNILNLRQRGCKGEAAKAFANFPFSFDAVIELGEVILRAPFAYDAHGHSRIVFSSQKASVPLSMKLSHLKYAEDNNRKEFKFPLDEVCAPRVYGFEVMSVFGHDASVLLLEREDITLARKFALLADRPPTPGTIKWLHGIAFFFVWRFCDFDDVFQQPNFFHSNMLVSFFHVHVLSYCVISKVFSCILSSFAA